MGSFDKLKYKTYDDSKGRGNSDKWKGAFKKRMKATEENKEEFFELMESVSETSLKKAYRKLSKVHHPDKGGNEEVFKRMNDLYNKLSRAYNK